MNWALFSLVVEVGPSENRGGVFSVWWANELQKKIVLKLKVITFGTRISNYINQGNKDPKGIENRH